MKVLYDHQIFSIQEYGGISRYFFEVMKVFEKTGELNFYISLKCSNNKYLFKLETVKDLIKCKKNSKFWKRITLKTLGKQNTYILNQEFSQKELLKQDYDVFHPTYYNPYFLKEKFEKPFVLTVHDMIHELYPEYFSAADLTISMKKKLIDSADEIICVSNNTRRDLLDIYPNVEQSKVHVIYHGSPFSSELSERSVKELDNSISKNKYLLYVGSRTAYKNFYFFIISSINILKKYPWLNIICAGGGEFSHEEILFFSQLGITEKISHYYVNDSQLAALYMNSLAFVFPSLYEGFGLPLLEAFTCRCPVICSNASSFPEIAKDSAIFFESKDIRSIQNAVESIIINNDLREEMIKKGLENAKKFNWDKTAKQVKNVYEKAITD